MARRRRFTFDPDPLLLFRRKGVGVTYAETAPDIALVEEPTHEFRVLRTEDLVNIRVRAFRCALVQGPDDQLVLAPDAEDAWLDVRFPFQHIAERAFFEKTEVPGPGDVPVLARAAHDSRLVFDVPDGELITFTSAGVLAALSRLPLRVSSRATPRLERSKPPGGGSTVPIAILGNRLLVTHSAAGLVVRSATKREHAALSIDDSVRSTMRAARGARAARRLLAEESALDLAIDVARPGLDVELVRVPEIFRIPKGKARRPRSDETAIEAPFRLILSPSKLGGFAHSTQPAAAPADPTRVELWHSRLGVRTQGTDGSWSVDERASSQRIVRAVWTRDIDLYGDDPPEAEEPFLTSLLPAWRRSLVRQSSESEVQAPEPVDATKLHLSALGAWLDLHGAWETGLYSGSGFLPIKSWDHIATMGRDQFVKVVFPGYLYPFGHKTVLTVITERKIKKEPGLDPQAFLYQRMFLLVEEPIREYEQHDLPFRRVRIRPQTTPDIKKPKKDETPHVLYTNQVFWPVVDGTEKFRFALDCWDHDGHRTRLHVPLLWVREDVGDDATKRGEVVTEYENDNAMPADGQWVTFAPSKTPGDTSLETATLRFTATPEIPPQAANDPGQRARPNLVDADVTIPAMKHLAPSATTVPVAYETGFAANGFTDATEVFLKLTDVLEPISYGGGTGQAGGFVQPDLDIKQLSRVKGAVGDLTPDANVPGFDVASLLGDAMPRLFGLFDLKDILKPLSLDKVPTFITEAVDRVEALVLDLKRLVDSVQATITRVDELLQNATGDAKAKLQAARTKLLAVQTDLAAQVEVVTTAFEDVLEAGTKEPADVLPAVGTALGALNTLVSDVADALEGAPLPPPVRATIDRLVAAVGGALADAGDLLKAVDGFLNALDPEGLAVRASYTWQPEITQWPATGAAVFEPHSSNALTLSVEARAAAAAGGSAGVDVLAELAGFTLHLLPGETMMDLNFGRIAFRATSGRKPEVDVQFDGITFKGILCFIETLRGLIPFDGFADPPHVEVSPEGVTAGFDLALPNVAVGVFSLENISLGADCRVPFLGDAVTVGFNFCSREKPFRLTVLAIGGGGFVGIRLSPEGLVLLEMSLEAGASLSIDLGVASGSVSVMVGVYMRLEQDKGSLTGYFRIRGEVDVLGLISASITLELSLTYEFSSGKMVGRASVVVEVEVLFFSASVEVSCEKRLAGGNADPTFAQIMGIEAPTTSSPHWDEYCKAFATP